nr:winged helix DNA-binding domain-containing protein [Kineosporia babensis]
MLPAPRPTKLSTVQITAAQALAWRLNRQFLSPRTSAGPETVVDRVCGVQAQVASAAATTIAKRQTTKNPGKAKLVKTWAMRGTLHLCTAQKVGSYLSLIAEARTWTKPSWQKAFGATPQEIDQLTEATRQILEGRALTRAELVEELLQDRQFQKIEAELRSGWGTLLKPLAWRGALCHGTGPDGRTTFTTPSTLIPGWAGIPDPEEAAPIVISDYLGAYGPSTPEKFDAWLTRGTSKKGTLKKWFAALEKELTEVEVDGQKAFVLNQHADQLRATQPSQDVHLLGPFDTYVLGAGTKDTWMLPAEHRSKVSRAAGWIAPVILHGGRIVGTWERQGDRVVPDFFPGQKTVISAEQIKQVIEDD